MGFMEGRHGNDELNRFIVFVSLILVVINLFFRLWILSSLVLLNIGIMYFRMLSRNCLKREAENEKYLDIKDRFFGLFGRGSGRTKDAVYCYYKCPRCGKKLRVPRGKGRVQIHCPQCGKEFIKRT